MSSLGLVVSGAGLTLICGAVALVLGRTPRLATLVAVLGCVVGCTAGLWGAIAGFRTPASAELIATWQVPGGALEVGIDALSAFFLAPLFALGALCAIYGRSYLGPRVIAAAELNLLLAAMVLVLIARHALLFLVAWEAMTLIAYLLVTFDDHQAEVRRAGWVYLIASHVALIALVGLFLALGSRANGALDFAAFAETWRAPIGVAGVLALAFLGFGIKAGVIGLHVWLPEAHAAAPSHVSALMSGVMIKLGVYGLLRTALLVSAGAGFGVTMMILGAMGALLGVALAIYQRDLKRVLAYSSVENVGIVLLGLGLGFWARAHGDPTLAAISFGAGFLHVWNHAAMKGLMFLGAGNVVHGSGTKDIEQLGGLLRRMPWTGSALLVGATALAALPPLNGFTGEWLLYRGLVQAGVHDVAPFNLAAIAGAATLALVGGLSAICFARLVGVTLLGTPRGSGALHTHDAPLPMTLPTTCLALLCIAGAFAAPALISTQASLFEQLSAASAADVAVATRLLSPVVSINAALFIAIAVATLLLTRRARYAAADETWGCGYAAPTSRMQYTGGAFSELLTARVVPRWLRATLRTRAPVGPFPTSAALASDTMDPLTRNIYEPLLVRWGNRFARLRFLQQGNVHIYVLYIVATAIVALAWVAVRDWLAS